MNLKIKIGSMELKNPVMTASGTFGYGTEYEDIVDVSKLGAIVTKTLTLEPRGGNPNPRIWELPYGMLNSIGLANVGVEAFIMDKLPALKRLKTKIIVNIAGKEAEDFAKVIQLLEPHDGFDAYELNVSCPNVKKGGMIFGGDPVVLHDITKSCRKATDRPIIVKLTPNVTDPGVIAKAAEEGGADALTVGNTVLGMAVDVEKRESRIPFVTAGYSGPGIKPVNQAKLYQIKCAGVEIPLIGCGGILDYLDGIEYIIIGAIALQIGSATYKNPNTASDVASGISNYMTKHGFEDIYALSGSLKTISN